MDNRDISPDLEQLKGYTQEKQALADQLRLVRQGLLALGRTEAVREIEEVVVKLAEDRFVLAVVGQFKRGKSSLMNAIIGQELLPTGVLPVTSAITILHYGPKPLMIVSRKGLSFPDRRSLGELADFVTERGNPGNSRMVSSVRVELPVDFLRYGIEFVDTPGIGSAIVSNTETTYDFLPQCDAVLFVTAADSPMTGAELECLRFLHPYVAKLFFILNKVDLLKPAEIEETRSYVAQTIQSVLGSSDIKIFEVSSRAGLNARLIKDATLYEESGLMRLEEELGTFLSKEKAAYFLQSIVRRALAIIDRERERGGFSQEALHAREIELAQQKVRTVQQEPSLAVSTILQAGQRLLALTGRANVEKPQLTTTPLQHQPPRIHTEPQPLVQLTLEDRGCPICSAMKESVENYLIQWQYELSSLEAAQEMFADELGFCSLHSWQLLAISSPYGASVGYARLADTLAHRLRAGEMLIDHNIDKLRRNERTCRVCGIAKKAETQAVLRLTERLNDPAEQDAYRQSQGACLRHLNKLIGETPSEKAKKFLLDHAAERFARDAEDMRSYALKRDALRRASQNSDEEDAYYRTIQRLAGDARVVGPWPLDGEI